MVQYKMRVLVIWHAAVVPEYRERFRAICRAQPNLDLHVIAPQKSFEGGQWIEGVVDPRDPFELHILPSVWTTHPNALLYKKRLRVLQNFNPDVVHLHEEAWTLGALQAIWAFHTRVPIVLETWENLVRRPKTPFQYVEPLVMRRVTRFIAGTPAVRDVAEERRQGAHRRYSLWNDHARRDYDEGHASSTQNRVCRTPC